MPDAKIEYVNTIRTHFSIGTIIKRGSKYLMIDRNIPPLGFACIAGHIDTNESPEDALAREVREESGLTVTKTKLLCEELIENNRCSKGISHHHWYVYSCEVIGDVKRNIRETKSIGWYTTEEISNLNLEPIWYYWLTKLKIIKL